MKCKVEPIATFTNFCDLAYNLKDPKDHEPKQKYICAVYVGWALRHPNHEYAQSNSSE